MGNAIIIKYATLAAVVLLLLYLLIVMPAVSCQIAKSGIETFKELNSGFMDAADKLKDDMHGGTP